MGRRAVTTVLVAVALGASAATPPSAAADGLPVPGGLDTTSQGVVGSSGAQRYLAIRRDDSTLVMSVSTGTGQILRSRWIDGPYSVPGVAIDGDTSGVSEDGSRLVLIRPRIRFPQSETSLVVLDPERLEIERRITLDGDFSFDAISPDGSTAFMIQYPDPRDPTSYELRTLDLETGVIDPGSLLPENDPGEEMRGFPLSRATGPGGRWEFTLYEGGVLSGYGRGEPGEPFVHAIDTVARRTLCIDLDWDLKPRTLNRLQLQLGETGEAIEVADPGAGGAVLGTIDIATGEATQAIASAAEPEPEATDPEQGSLWPAAALASASLALIAALAMLVRRRRGDRGPGSQAAD